MVVSFFSVSYLPFPINYVPIGCFLNTDLITKDFGMFSHSFLSVGLSLIRPGHLFVKFFFYLFEYLSTWEPSLVPLRIIMEALYDDIPVV